MNIIIRVHITPGKLENVDYSKNVSNVIRPHEPGKFQNETISGCLDWCLSKPQAGKFHDHRNVFEKLRFQNVLCPH